MIFKPLFSALSLFVPVENAELFCKVEGQGDPIIIIHGGPGMSHDHLLPHMSKLAENHQLIFYDQRACGQSTGELTSVNLETFIDDIEQIRLHFGYEKVTIFSHSWGGFLAMHYAIAHPDSVDKLILSNTCPASSAEIALFFQHGAERLNSRLEAIKLFAEQGDSVGYFRTHFQVYCKDPSSADLLNLYMPPQPFENYFKVSGICGPILLTPPFSLHSQLQQLNIPTLILHGDSDVVPPATVETIHQSIRGSTYILFEDCGHFPYVEVPDAFFAEIERFCEE